MSGSLDDVKQRFLSEIQLRAVDDRYIDRNEEREILQIALQLGYTADAARAALVQACDERGYVVESVILKQIKGEVEAVAGNGGRVDRKGFDQIVGAARRAVGGKKNEREIKKLVVTVMEDTGHNKVRTGWFSDWYAAVKREVGLA